MLPLANIALKPNPLASGGAYLASNIVDQLPHSQSSLAFLTKLLEIFSYEIHTIL
jgi:hypothetical protein